MKSTINGKYVAVIQSLPAWGAWIEMLCYVDGRYFVVSRSPHGERGLKFLKVGGVWRPAQVAPRMGSVD